MKNYVAPMSSVLSMNMNENIAASYGKKSYTNNYLFDADNFVVGVQGLVLGDNPTMVILNWIKENGIEYYDAINACYVNQII